MNAQVYLTYHDRDQKVAKAIISGLQNGNFIVVQRKTVHDPKVMDWEISNAALYAFIATPFSLKDQYCNEQLEHAIKIRKPIIPIKAGNVELPPSLLRRIVVQYDLTRSEVAIQRIIQHLSWMLSSKGEVRTLRDRMSDLVYELDRGSHQNSDAIQNELKYLEDLIQLKESQKLTDDHTTESGIVEEQENFRSKRLRLRSRGLQKTVGVPPLGANEFFKDRVDALADVINFVNKSPTTCRAITIYGKGGVGKTALACEAMRLLFEQSIHVYGQIFLSTRSHLGINLEQIFLGYASLLGGKDEEHLNRVWGEKITLQEKIEILREHVADKKIVLLLDNFEDLLGLDGKISDNDLAVFLDHFLVNQHNSKIIITSRERLILSNDVRIFMDYISLDTGLPTADAVSLLKSFDKDGFLRLRDCSNEVLESLAEKTHGYPRSLEAIAGILEQDPLISPADLVPEDGVFRDYVVESLVGDAHARLPQEALQVMQALAVFNRPVTVNAIRFLLAPFVSTNNLTLVINKLARGKFIHIFNNTKEIVIHPLDRAYSYNRLPE